MLNSFLLEKVVLGLKVAMMTSASDILLHISLYNVDDELLL